MKTSLRIVTLLMLLGFPAGCGCFTVDEERVVFAHGPFPRDVDVAKENALRYRFYTSFDTGRSDAIFLRGWTFEGDLITEELRVSAGVVTLTTDYSKDRTMKEHCIRWQIRRLEIGSSINAKFVPLAPKDPPRDDIRLKLRYERDDRVVATF
jgi:hypothetical protein